MAKYEVIRNCYGFQKRYWEKGQIVDLDPQQKIPRHFKLITDSGPQEPVIPAEPQRKEEPKPFAPQTLSQAGAGIPEPKKPTVQPAEGRAAGKGAANRNTQRNKPK